MAKKLSLKRLNVESFKTTDEKNSSVKGGLSGWNSGCYSMHMQGCAMSMYVHTTCIKKER